LQKIEDEKALCGVHKCGIEELAEKQGYAKALKEEEGFLEKNIHYSCRCITSENIICEFHKRLKTIKEELKSSLKELGKQEKTI
jgi:predicted transcriptional regulator